MSGRRNPPLSGLALSLLVILAACAPNPTPLPPLETGSEILSDNFATVNNTWTRFDTPESAAYVQQGEFFLEDRGRGTGVYSPLLGQEFSDVVIQVRVRHIEGTQDNWMGAICRQQDDANYYLFAISADGYYLILKVESGQPTALVGPALSDAIQAGRESNQLEVRCEGENLTLSINDILTISQTDSSFHQGQVALFADAVRGGTTTAAFDDFRLLQP